MSDMAEDDRETTIGEAAAIVADRLRLPVQSASNFCKVLDDGLFYFWSGTRGGGAAVVGPDRMPLYADSTISPEEHAAAYRSGRRS